MAGVAAIRHDVPDYDLMYVASVPVAFVPARVSVMLERAAEDALGVESASNLRMAAARDAARELVVGAAERIGVSDGTRRVQLARSLFSAFGEGRLSFELAGDSRRGIGQSLLHASWGPLTPGFQPDLFMDRAPAMEAIENKGFSAGLMAEQRVSGYAPKSDEDKVWTKGYDAGQKHQQKALKEAMDKRNAEAKAKKEIDEATPPVDEKETEDA